MFGTPSVFIAAGASMPCPFADRGVSRCARAGDDVTNVNASVDTNEIGSLEKISRIQSFA